MRAGAAGCGSKAGSGSKAGCGCGCSSGSMSYRPVPQRLPGWGPPPWGPGGILLACAAPTHPLPFPTGSLNLGPSCPACCSVPLVQVPGSLNPCGPTTPGGPGGTPHHQGMPPTGTTSVAGVSQLALDFTIDLSAIPPGARVLAVESRYDLGGAATGGSVTDNGGPATVTGGHFYVLWGLSPTKDVQSGIGGNTAFPAHATASFSGAYGIFSFHDLYVTWVPE